MTGIGPEFLKLLRGIEWDTLTARDAVDLRAALKDAMAKSDEWFQQLTKDFAGTVLEGALKRAEQDTVRVETGRPPLEAPVPPEPKASSARVRTRGTKTPRSVGPKRKRGRPPKARPNPIAIGGADAETAASPQAAKLFENSYVSKEGPRPDIPASLPADHPRLNMHRESSVTPDQDAADFEAVEKAIATGRGVKDIFQVR